MATLAPVVDVAAPLEPGPGGVATTTSTAPTDWRSRSRAHLAVGVIACTDVASVGLVAVLSARSAAPMPAGVVVGLGLLWMVLLSAAGAYQDRSSRHGHPRLAAALRAACVLGLCCWALPTLIDVPLRSDQLLVSTLTLTALALLGRLAADAWSERTDLASGGTRVLVAGEAEAVVRAVTELRRAPRGRWTVVSACVPQALEDGPLDVPVTIGLDDVAGAAAAAGARAVLLLPCRELDPHRVRRLGWQLENARTRLYVGTGLLDVAPARTLVVSVGDLHLVQLATAATGPARVKVVLERLAATLLLLVLAPLLLCVVLAVRLDSCGPAIFRQVRVGKDGREFVMYKFRTMCVDAESSITQLVDHNESEGALLFKIRRDPRITRIGAILRRYSIDELPQLINVVLGDMALVGPRPALPSEVARYDDDPRRRLAVRPGLTGLWQVSGRSDLSWEETVRLDLHYVDNWSPALDVRIICRTVRAVLSHDGAY